MQKILTIADLKSRAPKLSLGQINETLRPIGIRIGKIGDEWFADFCRDHPEFKDGAKGTRSFGNSKADAIDDALASAAWYRRSVAFVDDIKAA